MKPAPNLDGLVDKVAAAIGAKPVDIIVLDGEFNAAYGQVGLRRRRVLTLELAMWNALDDQERIAVVGHERAHEVNGDLAHGFVVGSALRTLAEWHAVLRTPPRHQSTRSMFEALEAIGELMASAFMRVLRAIVARLFEIEMSLLFASRQRAEYFADLMSARVASTSAAVFMLDHLYLARQASQSSPTRRDEKSPTSGRPSGVI